MDPDQLASLVTSVDPDQLVRNYTVFNARCEFVIIYQNMKYRLNTFVLVQGQENRNFQLVLDEMGPCRTSRAWYFHSPGGIVLISVLSHHFTEEEELVASGCL